jgi:hypothetical protein
MPTFSEQQFKELIDAVKHTPASTTPTAVPLHGVFHGNTSQYGILTTPGVRPERFSTLSRPWSLASILTPNASRYWQEKLEVMTGVTAASGTNATGWCADPPTVGQGKICKQNFEWGDYYVKTDLNIIPYVGQLKDRADVPAEIINGGTDGNPYMPDILFRLDDTQSLAQYEIWRIGVEFERTFDKVLVTGDTTVASANSEHGWFNEFKGLDLMIATGYTDADTGIACPAMDSDVITYSANINTTTADGRNIVQALGDLMYALRQRAMKFQMAGVQFAIVMREELFRSFVEQYSCLYQLYACAGSQYEENNIDQRETNRLRMEMLNGRYLLVDGVPVPVVFTEGIVQTTPAANTFESDMYVVPVSWAGMPLLRLEYFPMDNQYLLEKSSFTGHGHEILNNGMWIASSEETAFCKELHFGTRMRLILETPFLAGRIDNLQYTFSANIRNALPGASFYADGGSTYRS